MRWLADSGRTIKTNYLLGGAALFGSFAFLGWVAFASCPKAAAPEPRAYGRLAGRSIAILASDHFDAKWLVETRARLAAQGAKTFVVAPNPGIVTAKDALTKEDKVAVDVDISLPVAAAASFDALVLPGGEGVQALRQDPRAIEFVSEFVAAKKPIAAVGEATTLLTKTPHAVRGRDVTATPQVKEELERHGAVVREQPMVADGEIITCRNSAETRVVTEKLARTITPPVPKALPKDKELHASH